MKRMNASHLLLLDDYLGELTSILDVIEHGCPHRLAMAMLFFLAGDIQWYKVLMKSGISN
jgi:hypothetical protein